MNRAALGRADLIRWADNLDENRLRRLAESLGYQESPMNEESVLRDLDLPTRDRCWSTFVAAVSETGTVRHRHYRLTERHALAPPLPLPTPDPPPPQDPVAPLAAPPPLVPWPRLWPFLRAALGEYGERRRLDLPRAVAAVCRARPLRRLPRLKGPRWAPRGQLILDLHRRLYPFWDDFNALKDSLPRLRGAAGLAILRMDEGPAGPLQTWDGRAWGPPCPYAPPPAGTPVLIAGDLGCLGTPGQGRAWVAFGRRLAAGGILPAALTPCPARWWDPALAGLFYPVVLDRTAAFPPRPAGPRPWPTQAVDLAEAIRRDPGALYLLTLLSACIAITPALLRHLRHRLPVGLADVGSEAAAWLHPAGAASDFALLPGDPAQIERLRESFGGTGDQAQRDLAWALIRAQQERGASQAERMEERVLFAAMQGLTDPAAEAFLARVAEALVQSRGCDDDEQARFLAAWVNRRARRTHPGAWAHSPASEALWLLANPPAESAGAVLPAGFDLHRAAKALERPERPQTWSLVQLGDALDVEPWPASAADFAMGSPVVQEVLTRLPVVQVRELRAGAPDLSLPLDAGGVLPLSERGWRVRTDQEELVIEPFERPDWAHLLGRDRVGLFAGFRYKGVAQRLRWIGPGRFLMGSPAQEHERRDNEEQHEVILTRGFWLAETACTQALWQAVMGGNPSHFTGEKRPVEQVSWDDTQRFIERLNAEVPGLAARLPTEAECEYGCRAGTTTPFSCGEDIDPAQANYNGNYPYRGDQKGLYRKQTVDVATLPPNPWGLYEMHGNVWEWCQDWFGDYPTGPVVDPVGVATGRWRVARGGSWFFGARRCRSAQRGRGEPANRSAGRGFRLARGP